MSYFPDLSEYEYARKVFFRPRTQNVGWLDGQHAFDVALPSEELLDALWRFCHVSVAQMRGFHICELCNERDAHQGRHHGEGLLLGTSEIRAFADDGVIFAAPTLIFHYVERHHYRPPDAFVVALLEGPCPPHPAYFDRLAQLGLEWNETSRPQGSRRGPTPLPKT